MLPVTRLPRLLPSAILIEHSENKIILLSELSENEIRPRVLKSSVQRTCVLQERKKQRPLTTFQFCYSLPGILVGEYLLNTRLEHSRSK